MSSLVLTERTAAYEVWDAPGGTAPVVVSCEHASAELPDGWSWPEEDRWLLGTHWSYDIGAADLARDLAAALGCPAVLAGFSRLLIDPNRDLDKPTLYRLTAEGRPIHLNAGLTDAERARRLDTLYRPYHRRLSEAVAARPGALLVAMHTFTPVYEGEARHLEVGVLFDHDEALGVHIADALAAGGLHVRLNEPYSGRHGMMFAAQSHADAHGRAAVELEVRQDLAGSPPWRRRFTGALARALTG